MIDSLKLSLRYILQKTMTFQKTPGPNLFRSIQWMQNRGSFPYWVSLFLTLMTLLVYWQVRSFEFIHLDDPAFVTENDYVKMGVTRESLRWMLWGDVASNWHPLTMLSHMVDVTLYGVNPGAHHVTNVQLHILNTLLVFWIGYRLIPNRWYAFWIALIFSIHPLHVESVAWVSERKDVLSTLFGLLCIRFYIHYTDSGKKIWYWCAFAALLFGLFAKPMLVTFPFLLVLLDFWPLQRLFHNHHLKGIVILEKIPLIILSLSFSIITYFTQHITGAVLPSQSLPLYVRVANAFDSYVIYIYQSAWPLRLSVFYPYPKHIIFIQYLGSAIGILGASFLFFKYRNKFPWGFVGWFWFIGTLIPVIGFIQVGTQAHADRYMYIPMIGLLIIVVDGISHIGEKYSIPNTLLGFVFVFLSVFYGFLGYRQVSKWENTYQLFSQAVAHTGGSAMAYSTMGVYLKIHGDIAAAEQMFLKALNFNDRDALAHMNLIDIYGRTGDQNRKRQQFDTLMRINPTHYVYQLGIAGILIDQNEWNQAKERLKYYVAYNPFSADALGLLGVVEAELGDVAAGIDFLKKAEKLKPDHPAVHANLGVVYRSMGKIESAKNHFEKALWYDPANTVYLERFRSILRGKKELQDRITLLTSRAKGVSLDCKAQLELAQGYRLLENYDQAILALEKARKCDSIIEEVLYRLGILYAEKARYTESIESFRRLIEINPAHAEGHYRIASVYARMNRPDETCQALKTAIEKDFRDEKRLRNDPNFIPVHEAPCFQDILSSLSHSKDSETDPTR